MEAGPTIAGIAAVLLCIGILTWFYMKERRYGLTEPAPAKPAANFSVNRDTVFTDGLRVPDTADIKTVQAAPYVENKVVTIKALNIKVKGEPLIWQNTEQTAAFVNDKFFSDLKVVDATRLDEKVSIGTIQEHLLLTWTADHIIHFLIKSGLIRTFIHTHADVRLLNRVGGISGFVEEYEVTHYFYTNQENQETFRFGVEINKRIGTITVYPS